MFRLFLAFLETVFAGDKELIIIAYIQKFFGYVLTGETIEHAMMFFYGTGANGKSVLVSTITGILGSYHRTAPIETFTASNMPRHSTDLRGLGLHDWCQAFRRWLSRAMIDYTATKAQGGPPAALRVSDKPGEGAKGRHRTPQGAQGHTSRSGAIHHSTVPLKSPRREIASACQKPSG